MVLICEFTESNFPELTLILPQHWDPDSEVLEAKLQ